MNKTNAEISLLLLDVLRGYSKLHAKNGVYYLKHFVAYEDLELAEFEVEAFKSAIKMGVKKEDDLLKKAIDRKIWSEDNEKEIKNLKWVIDKSEKALAKVSDWNLRKSLDQNIDSDRNKLKDLEDRRYSIISHSAEKFAARKRNAQTLLKNVFVDESLTKPVDEDDLFDLMPIINETIVDFVSVDNIVRMAYDSSFFDLYSVAHRDPIGILGKNMYNISIWQKNLLFYASVLLNKIRNMDIPDDIREDAVKIYKYKGKPEKEEGKNIVHGVDDIKAKMAKNNGKLSAEDF